MFLVVTCIDFFNYYASLIVAVLAVAISIFTLITQRNHNKLSVRPLPFIEIGNYENEIYVKIINHGTGPFIFKNMKIKKDNVIINSGVLVDYIISEEEYFCCIEWETYVEKIETRPLSPNESITLIQFDPTDPIHIEKITEKNCEGSLDKSIDADSIRNNIRKILGSIIIEVIGSDIYNTKVTCDRDLNVFIK